MEGINVMYKRIIQHKQHCDDEMHCNAVKKKWGSWISKILANLQRGFKNKSHPFFTQITLVPVWEKMDQYIRN